MLILGLVNKLDVAAEIAAITGSVALANSYQNAQRARAVITPEIKEHGQETK